MVIPKNFKKMFWDIDVKTLKNKNSDFVITRLAEKGGLDAGRWLLKTFGKRKVKNIVKSSRNVSIKSKNFWSII